MAKTGMQMITNTLARLYKLPAADAMAFVDTFFAIISSELKNGRQVKVKGLGTFKVQSVKPRESVNVNTGERVLIEGHDKVTFTPDTAMKELVNKPFSQFETVVINDGVPTEDLERIPSDEEMDSSADESSTGNIGIETEKTDEKDSPHDIRPAETTPEQPEEIIETSMERTIHITGMKPAEKTGGLSDEEKKQSSAVDEGRKTLADNAPASTDMDANEVDDKNTEEERTPAAPQSPKAEKPQSLPDHTAMDNADDSDVEESENGMLKTVALAAAVVIIILGGFLWIRFGKKNLYRKPAVAVQKKNTSDNGTVPATKAVSADTVAMSWRKSHVQANIGKEKADSFAAMSHDARIRYGAYNIVGIDRVVVLKKGQTMKSYSRSTLGADMIGYFQVLNGRNTMQAGDTMKVPKVELRPEYRR